MATAMAGALRCRALITMTNGTGAACSPRRKMQPGQQTTTRTEQRMDNDARIGNSIPEIGPMHGERKARTTACKAESRSALATGTLLLLLCLPSFAACAQATAPRTGSDEHTA